MKRVLITLEDIAAFDNLSQAAHQAARAKRDRPDIQPTGCEFFGWPNIL
jgi:hypothetical protein